MTSFVAVLHPGESLSLPLDTGKYFDLSESKQYQEARFPAGKYSLQTELSQKPSEWDAATKRHWTGRVSSNIVEVLFESEFSAPLDDYLQYGARRKPKCPVNSDLINFNCPQVSSLWYRESGGYYGCIRESA